jgi:hypothetical protein
MTEINCYLPQTHIKIASPRDLRGMGLSHCFRKQKVTPRNFPQHTPPYPHAHSRPHLRVGKRMRTASASSRSSFPCAALLADAAGAH